MWFDQNTPVVDFAPTSAPHRYGERRWFLWPMLAWRVAVPVVRWRGLNLFQHYTLALLEAGCRAPKEIGRRLDLDVQLVGRVLQELGGMGYIGPAGIPSERARKYLRENDHQEPEVIPGYVFRDAISGSLQPRFVPNTLRYIPVISEKGIQRRAKVDRSSSGRRDVSYCTTIWPDRKPISDPTPTADQIRNVCRTWARHMQAFERFAVTPSDWAGEIKEVFRALGDGRITVLSSESEPVFVTSFVYFPEHLGAGTIWQVCDPFGLGVSPQLRGHIEEWVDSKNEDLIRLLDDLDEAALRVDGRDLAEMRGKRREIARGRVTQRVESLDVPDSVRQVLELMEMSRVGYEESSSSNRREQQRHLTAQVRRAYIAIEALFFWMTRVWSGTDVVARLGMTAEHNASLLTELALKLGFENDDTLDSLSRLFLVRRGHVKGVLVDGNTDLRAMAACALLSTVDHNAHPLRLAAVSLPDLFVLLDRIKRERDPVAHHGVVVVSDDAEEWVCEAVYSMCRVMLPTLGEERGAGAAPVLVDEDEYVTWSVRLAQRLQARAVRKVDKMFGLSLRQIPGVRTELVEVVRRQEEIHLLAEERANTVPASMELLVAGGKLLEAMMTRLVSSAPKPGWVVASSEDEIREAARTLAEEVGFDFDESVASIIHAKLRLVQRAARTGRGTLSALTTVALLACRDHSSHPFRAIAQIRPDFLKTLADLVQARGHGDRALDPEESDEFARTVVSMLKSTFGYIS